MVYDVMHQSMSPKRNHRVHILKTQRKSSGMNSPRERIDHL
ncbi:rCG46939 [Rattus norvegicus]|uniref:RCG46939 n=1 Tax=Rattus norvegicus TaxID=10116 RepID=A6IXN3_RAT|nr:rCG46939 [Rattus norvegicus]